jgi:signal transduction histidine kinase
MAPHDVNRAISRTLFLLENQSLFHNIEIEKLFEAQLPPVQADGQQLNHLFMNIILNAAQAMQGKGKLKVRTFRETDRNNICIEISDSGPGIPPDILPRIFEPFFTTKEEGDGTGLGLSLAYGIVENHRGQIKAHNKPDGGAVFMITFPVVARDDQGEQRAQNR